MDIITSRDNPKIKYAVKIASDPGARRKENAFFASSSKAVLDIISAGFERKLIFATQEEYARHCRLLPRENVYIVSQPVADKLSEGKTDDGMYRVFAMKENTGTEDFFTGNLLVLQDVQDPGNMGAIMRTALAFGFDSVAVSAGCADVYSRKVIRSSMTASVKLNVMRISDAAEFAALLADKGYCTVAACLEGAQELGKRVIGRPAALFIGSEGQGLGRDVIAACEMRIKIPMSDRIESLNAAVSAAVLMWELR